MNIKQCSFLWTKTAHVADPAKAHNSDAGYDLHVPHKTAVGDVIDIIVLNPGQRVILPLGIKIILPEGCFAMLCPRSGLAASHGIGFVNGVGIIDNGYHGELSVIVCNYSNEAFAIIPGMRIAQLVLVAMAEQGKEAHHISDDLFNEIAQQSDRGENGLGSTGL